MNLGWVMGIGWMTLWLGISVGNVNKMSAPAKEHPWYLPVVVATLLIPTFIFGVIAGGS